MVPFWTNFLVRTIGWQIILAPQGWLSSAAAGDRACRAARRSCYTRAAVLLGVVYNYLPLMILPLFVAFDRVDPALREASKDLGAEPLDDVPRSHPPARPTRASSRACCSSTSR